MSWGAASFKSARFDSVKTDIFFIFAYAQGFHYQRLCLWGVQSSLTDTISTSDAGRDPLLRVLQYALLKWQGCHPEEKSLHVLPWKYEKLTLPYSVFLHCPESLYFCYNVSYSTGKCELLALPVLADTDQNSACISVAILMASFSVLRLSSKGFANKTIGY